MTKIAILVKKLKSKNLLLQEEIIKKTMDLMKNKLELRKSQSVLESAYERLDQSEHDRFSQMNKLAHLGLHIGGVMHDIRNPLMYVMYEIRESNIDNKKEINNALKEILQYVNSIRGIIVPNSNCRRFRVYTVVNSAIEMAKPRLKNIKYTLINKINKSLSINGDESKFRQIIMNLVDNAIDAVIVRNCPEITIVVEKNIKAGIISVIDNGDGISSRYLRTLYHPFVTTKEDGNGLGLHISQSYAKKFFKGEISYVRKNSFTYFVFSFKITKD